ncbi:MerR family DNA-binding transcriptional regulator [Arsukibacterium indicum]|uniref:MerR family DNA-binding transcriptional regulator n=1 Tax=Arsukibacterium indicum TaxID=2848612 RepID=A0ABS6MJF8_9GAMM|nr:MerR family DNA-binding transcriptional regulator [Arsukibacterium indicum]MBV2128952.1 MerR family DNA-binding transcriptional regulator [Arsukibacterium indicum]
MKIGELVKRHGVSVDTIRFYEKQQLLRPSARSEAGYRL